MLRVIAGLWLSQASVDAQILSRTNPATIDIAYGAKFATYSAQDRRAPVDSLYTKNALKNIAKPTNAWWQNLVLGTGVSPDNLVTAEPYVLFPQKSNIGARYGYQETDTAQQMSLGWFGDALTLGSVETITTSGVDSWDDTSVKYLYTASQGTMLAPLVRGMLYTTMKYSGLTPYFGVGNMDIDNATAWAADGTVTFPEGHPSSSTVFTGTRFEFKFRDISQTWRLYSSEPVSLSFDGKNLTADHAFADGYFRLAMVNNCTYGVNPAHCTVEQRALRVGTNTSAFKAVIDAHAGAVVMGGNISYANSNSKSYLAFHWVKESFPGDNSKLAHAAMPHHYASFDSKTAAGIDPVGRVHRTLRGQQVVVKADSWTTVVDIPVNGWNGPNPVPASRKQDIIDAIIGNKERGWAPDVDWLPPQNWQDGVGDTYYSGKVYARMARIALIAEEVGEKEAAMKVAFRLKEFLNIWLDRTNLKAAPMMYDQSWGGLLSCGCQYDDCNGKCNATCSNMDKTGTPIACPEMLDPGSSFGAGWYNDHHFHYGYFIYAFAAVGKFYPLWLKEHSETTLLFVRDIANPDGGDIYFPKWRHKDWYAGFSWASGFPLVYRNGRNQESSAEAVNAYFGVYSYGLATKNSDIENLGLAMLAHEIQGAHTYWQVPADSDVYPRDQYSYATLNTVVGIMWQNLIQYSTWFGANPTYIHGIQHLPYIPISQFFLARTWVEEEWQEWDNVSNPGWQVTSMLNQALVDRDRAWNTTMAYGDSMYDGNDPGCDGHSRTNSLHFIATLL